VKGGILFGSLMAVSVVARTAYLGGKIIHDAPILQLKEPPPGLPPGLARDTARARP
jgi:hypothetical protein